MMTPNEQFIASTDLSRLAGNIQLANRALKVSRQKTYISPEGRRVDLQEMIERSLHGKVSIPPWRTLAEIPSDVHGDTEIDVVQETTLQAARRLYNGGEMPMVLNFANGFQPGGGFLLGADTQEESLCRYSALYQTLLGDRMYTWHSKTGSPDFSNWAILSPEVPVFATEQGKFESKPWTLGILTCAAPVAGDGNKVHCAKLMESRIDRVLHIAVHHGYGSLVLGAWGCGAFGNDPHLIAKGFHNCLHGRFKGIFDRVVFAVTNVGSSISCFEAFHSQFA
jgi:uncharacterized protein (TIGR02452 family)